MAQRRMFSKQITETDLFMDMPLSSQALYLHLLMNADDDGFIGNAKTIVRMVGGSNDDFKLLIAKQFIIVFDDGITVIKDWRIHNYIQKDRYHQTIYKDHLKELSFDKNGAYIEFQGMYPECIQDVSKMDTQVRLGKVKLGKESLGKDDDEENKSLKNENSNNPFQKMNIEELLSNNPEVADLSNELFSDLIVDNPDQAVIAVEAIIGQYWRLRALADDGNTTIVVKEQLHGKNNGIISIIKDAGQAQLEYMKPRLANFNMFGHYFEKGLIDRVNTAISSGGNSDATV
ncbi:hypothetical protein PAF15_01420 [Weissella koreensis]|uniref:hypothetical protein n=1 Tax=Weissella koreensis TaxID=165096 RepID=UPI0022BA4359|nr:hypothetical protein [Weissella koreensis]MCZ9310637.1 hypothetical protein [Weissella koreensis]